MGSNFGGDGGDTITDPANGCNIAQEYVYLDMWVTQNCGVNDGSWTTDPTKATEYEVAPPDKDLGGAGARFIAPITTDAKDTNTWVAGGRHVWVQNKGFAIRSGAEWKNAYDLGDGHVATAVASSGGTVYVGWCGPCNNQGFSRGIAVGNADGTGWHQLNLPVDGTDPQPLHLRLRRRPGQRPARVRRGQRLLPQVDRGPRRGHRPRLRIEGRRSRLDGHLGEPARRARQHGQAAPERRLSPSAPTWPPSTGRRAQPSGRYSARACPRPRSCS